MNATSLRTQIILPENLREKIDRQRKMNGESLAEYLRVAALERLEREKKKKTDLKKLAEEVIGSCKGTRTDEEIKELTRQIRKDREEEEKHWLKRIDETR